MLERFSMWILANPKQLQEPTTVNENDRVDQKELNRKPVLYQAQENECDQFAVRFGFAPVWSNRWHKFF